MTTPLTPAAWVHLARARPSWYSLPLPQRQELQSRWQQLKNKSIASGATTQGTFDVRAQSDYSILEMWTFPDAGAAFLHWTALCDAGYAQWFAFANTVGTAAGGDAV